jgi:hypothetical protein
LARAAPFANEPKSTKSFAELEGIESMLADQIRKSKLSVSKQARSKSCKRDETRLVLPPPTNPQAAEAALQKVIDIWLLPGLLEEFLKEHGITPKTRFLQY